MKKWKIIFYVLLISHICTYVLILIRAMVVKNDIDMILRVNEHNDKIVYISNNSLYYMNNKVDTNYNIVWIDDSCIIYSKEENERLNYYLLKTNSNNIIYSSKDLNEFGIIYKNDSLFFISSDDTYNRYDINNESLTKISAYDYYKIRDGEIINVSLNYYNGSIESLYYKKINENNTLIDINDLKKNNLLKKFYDLDFYIYDYSVYSDSLIIHLKSDNYIYSVLYDANNFYYYELLKIDADDVKICFINNSSILELIQ